METANVDIVGDGDDDEDDNLERKIKAKKMPRILANRIKLMIHQDERNEVSKRPINMLKLYGINFSLVPACTLSRQPFFSFDVTKRQQKKRSIHTKNIVH